MYVAFEGIDCVGKSTQITLLKETYKDGIFTLEPGGTELGKYLRQILLNKNNKISKKSELLLFLADRAQHFEEVLKPNKNKLIISDRSFISGMAYAQDFDNHLLFSLNRFVLEEFFPQKIIFLKADKKLIKERLGQKKLDNIEKRGVEYFLNVQNKLEKVLEFLNQNIQIKILKLNANQNKEILHQEIKEFLQ
ncbi:dTMP kinase [Campylobacter hepaticus]|uniref:Thymidylate kinase n=1 Tax=Campylobacter hepaticus TaxID=1813019 RepID=A0A424Z2I5_9BACT|nr:dTMP kinase [Campylobacter hepaticus]AXP08676.1 dTMP kinase [Campylobacter hepaticus]MCZ0772520.1 dTMP kinase [Campylobacter hepaticus]MCZ0773988.1 dTMP kinase [Campylobacter hepaticus]MCZ0775240.1 dTMP kinase [Campylobacter hepaticus]MDX2323259.1 dTMP kinase [Campylobacter hepaticus]